ncbi:cupin domain-containing protein [Pandoraea pulmonicola]|uniref:Anti-sigma factor n=1 Tax=Pandoraea pulmonicola TaxID=93221 RepID=A0AAJ4Z8J8_PANPU|nr:cupin domain-containing protein [Pandoraea pulmonicola]AJC22195.1 anti-sigma factor [Pandoraea pulmonicola]SUA88764.1 anti-sigma factor, putative, ChrR family [Pandoraea pulmonicola]
MLVNADLSLRAAVEPHQYRWVDSPQPGVERVMLDRLGGEKARATSIVRYAPGSQFPRHQHPGGEEILVLSGTFSEGGEHYPAGWYMRNPPGSSHQPSSEVGAVIFVKLWQMRASESRRVRIDTRDASAWTVRGGRAACLLFADQIELVSMERLPAGVRVCSGPVEGSEILVLEGALHEGAHRYDRGSWIRLPPGEHPDLVAGDAGATMYLKTGHLSAHAREKGIPC